MTNIRGTTYVYGLGWYKKSGGNTQDAPFALRPRLIDIGWVPDPGRIQEYLEPEYSDTI